MAILLRSLLSVLALSPLLAEPALATPSCQVRGTPYLEGRIRGSNTPMSRVVEARIGQEIEVYVVLPGTLDGNKVLFSEEGRPGHVSYAGVGCGTLQVSYLRVEPRMAHKDLPPPNKDLSIYANAVVFGPRHGTWIGYDRLEYLESPLSPPGPSGPSLIVTDARPSDEAGVPKRPTDLAPLGTLRLSASVRLPDGRGVTAKGAKDAPSGLISSEVFRYSFRQGDDFRGWLTTFFNVPYLFGSAGQGEKSQAERYLGADCADALVAALRRSGHREIGYSSVAGMVDSLRRVAEPVLICPVDAEDCPQTKPNPVLIGPLLKGGSSRDTAQIGDLLALDYVDSTNLPRSWDHIGVLWEDRGPNGVPDGVLGPEDLFLDSGDAQGLKLAPLSDQGKTRVQVLRPKMPK